MTPTDTDKLESAKAAFIEMREMCKHSGKSISIAAVAKKAGVDRKYLYGEINTPNEQLKKRWKDLGDQIRAFKRDQQDNPDARKPERVRKLQDCQKKLETALKENYGILEEIQRSKSQISTLTKQRNEALDRINVLQNHIYQLEAERRTATGKSRPTQTVVSINAPATIISPDELRAGEDPLARKKAWSKALTQLRQALARPVEYELYVTIGIPGAGKTHWSKSFRSRSNKASVIFDSTNLNRVDRYDILDIAHKASDVKIIAVCFTAPFDRASERNRLRFINEKFSDDKIKALFQELEYPAVLDTEERFDEIIIIRNVECNE